MSFQQKSLSLLTFFACILFSLPIQPIATNITKINKNNFLSEVLQSKNLVVIHVFAPWCQACQQMSPIVEKLSLEFPNTKFVSINVDEETELAKALEIAVIPTFFFFYQNKVISGFTGQKSYEDFKNIILHIQKNNVSLYR